MSTQLLLIKPNFALDLLSKENYAFLMQVYYKFTSSVYALKICRILLILLIEILLFCLLC